jgi:hypothetical protein
MGSVFNSLTLPFLHSGGRAYSPVVDPGAGFKAASYYVPRQNRPFLTSSSIGAGRDPAVCRLHVSPRAGLHNYEMIRAHHSETPIGLPAPVGSHRESHKLQCGLDVVGLKYPGEAAAPLVVMADPNGANDSLRQRTGRRKPSRRSTPHSAWCCITTPSLLRRLREFGALIATVTGYAAIGDVPWRKALDVYRGWLDTAMGAVTYPSWMWEGQGMLDIQ